MGQGLVRVALREEKEPQVVMGLRIAGIDAQGGGKGIPGFGHPAEAQLGDPQLVVAVRILGRQAQRRGEVTDRFVEMARSRGDHAQILVGVGPGRGQFNGVPQMAACIVEAPRAGGQHAQCDMGFGVVRRQRDGGFEGLPGLLRPRRGVERQSQVIVIGRSISASADVPPDLLRLKLGADMLCAGIAEHAVCRHQGAAAVASHDFQETGLLVGGEAGGIEPGKEGQVERGAQFDQIEAVVGSVMVFEQRPGGRGEAAPIRGGDLRIQSPGVQAPWEEASALPLLNMAYSTVPRLVVSCSTVVKPPTPSP